MICNSPDFPNAIITGSSVKCDTWAIPHSIYPDYPVSPVKRISSWYPPKKVEAKYLEN